MEGGPNFGIHPPPTRNRLARPWLGLAFNCIAATWAHGQQEAYICVVYISALVIRYKSQGGCHIGRDVATGGGVGGVTPLNCETQAKIR